VLNDSRLVAPVSALLGDSVTPGQLSIVHGGSLRGEQVFSRLVLLGDTRYLPSHVFSAPRAPEVWIAGLAWQDLSWRFERSFRGPVQGVVAKPTLTSQSANTRRPRLQYDFNAGFDADEFERHSIELAHRGEDLDKEATAARLYRLYGGNATYLDASGGQTTLVVDLSAPIDERVRQLSDSQVEIGMFVVLRTDTAGDYIQPVADTILGKSAREYRKGQTEWKSRLRSQLDTLGTEALIERLNYNNATSASPQNIRNWASDYTIAPSARENFFAIADVCGLGSEAERLWFAAVAIRRAHQQAGQTIRWELVQQVKQADANDLIRDGQVHFVLPSNPGVRLTAFQVEWRAERTSQVPLLRVERLIPAGA
jgi:hypothetical protein